MPSPINPELTTGKTETLRAMEDEELDRIAGGYEVVLQNEEGNRDSWFVSLVMRRMIQDEIRRALATPPHEVPDVITVGSRRFRVRKTGEDYYVEEIRI